MSRHDWIDGTKGFGIILVVFGHVLNGIALRGLIDDGLYQAIDARIYAFHMPLFFVISGFFILRLIEKRSLLAFMGSRILRLVYPMVLWTYLFYLARIAAGSLANHVMSWDGLMIWPIPGKEHFWFLWALFLLHMASLVLKPAIGRIAGTWLGAAGFLISLFVVGIPLPEETAYWIGNAVHYAPYFAFGIMMGTMLDRLPRVPLLVSVPVFAGLVYVFPLLDGVGIQLEVFLVLIICLSAMAALHALQSAPLMDKLAHLGRISLAIYVSHTVFSATMREALLKLDVTDLTAHLVIGTLAGLVFPLTLYHLAARLGAAGWLGFELPSPPAKSEQRTASAVA